MKTAVFPGSFDPFTLGHESIVRKALPLFDRIIVAIGANSMKSGTFDLEKRTQWIKETFADCPSVDVVQFQGLTVDFCQKNEAQFILRGLRNPNDYQYESSIAQMNQARKFANTKNILIHQNFNRILTFDFGGVTLLRLMITLLRLMKCQPYCV